MELDDTYEGSPNMEEIAEDLKTNTQCLLELGARVQGPPVSHMALFKELNPWDVFVDRIIERYPKCEVGLALCLRQVNWSRAYRCLQIRRENSIP